MDKNHIGDLAEAMVIAALIRRGERVLKPISPSCRYDLVLDRNGHFYRVQCKTARLNKHGAVEVPTSNPVGRVNTKWKPYYGHADLFGAYCPDTDKCYLIPVDECGPRSVSLRVHPSKNNQASGIRYAKDFEI